MVWWEFFTLDGMQKSRKVESKEEMNIFLSPTKDHALNYEKEDTHDNVDQEVQQTPKEVYQVTHIFCKKGPVVLSLPPFTCLLLPLQFLYIGSSVRPETLKRNK